MHARGVSIHTRDRNLCSREMWAPDVPLGARDQLSELFRSGHLGLSLAEEIWKTKYQNEISMCGNYTCVAVGSRLSGTAG